MRPRRILSDVAGQIHRGAEEILHRTGEVDIEVSAAIIVSLFVSCGFLDFLQRYHGPDCKNAPRLALGDS